MEKAMNPNHMRELERDLRAVRLRKIRRTKLLHSLAATVLLLLLAVGWVFSMAVMNVTRFP